MTLISQFISKLNTVLHAVARCESRIEELTRQVQKMIVLQIDFTKQVNNIRAACPANDDLDFSALPELPLQTIKNLMNLIASHQTQISYILW